MLATSAQCKHPSLLRLRCGDLQRQGVLAAGVNTICVGFVSPQTGPLAAFGKSSHSVLEGAKKAPAAGLDIGGTTYDVETLNRDSQSNPNRAAKRHLTAC